MNSGGVTLPSNPISQLESSAAVRNTTHGLHRKNPLGHVVGTWLEPQIVQY